jgi:hypothetical protein
MRRFRVITGIVAFAAVLAGGTAPAQADGDRSVEAVATRLVALLAEPGPVSAAQVRERVDGGVPPGALLVLLDAYRAQPRADLVDVVRGLGSYRGVEVRARALAAWAALGGNDAVGAITAAAADTDPLVRKLAVALAAAHPSSRADEIVAELLRSDTDLAAELAVGEGVPVPQDPQ